MTSLVSSIASIAVSGTRKRWRKKLDRTASASGSLWRGSVQRTFGMSYGMTTRISDQEAVCVSD
jgi:hypothetical protein